MATTIAPETLTKKIEIAKQIVSAPSDLGEDFELAFGNRFNWEHLLSPAPLVINILGDLMAVAACLSNFSLNEVQPKDGYEFIKYPTSFKASLIQISNSGYQAFMLTHNNMDQIRLITQSIPSTMENVKKILESKNEKLIDKILPIQLKRITKAVEQCATLSREVVDIFNQVINLMDEVLTAVTDIKGLKEKQLDDTRKEQEVLEVVVTNITTRLGESKKDKELLEKTVKEAQNDVHEVIRNRPSSWMLVRVFYAIFNFLFWGPIKLLRKYFWFYTNLGPSADVPDKVNLDEEGLRKNFLNVMKIFDIATQLDKFAAMDFKNTDSSKKSEFSVVKYISMLETIAKEALGCETVEKICQAGIDVMKTLEGLLSSGSDTKEVKGKIQDFSKQAEKLTETVNSMSNPDSGRMPSMSNDLPSSDRVSEFEVAKEKAKVEEAKLKVELKMALENAEKAKTQLQRMEFSEKSYGEATKLLQDGLANMTKQKEKWFGLVCFFNNMSDIVHYSMNKNLLELRKSVHETSTDLNCQVNLQRIYDSAINATQASSFIHGMASMFTKVSVKYIMPNMAGLNQLIAFDAETDGISIDQKREELLQSCIRDSNEIDMLIVAEKNALIIRIKDRKEIVRDQ